MYEDIDYDTVYCCLNCGSGPCCGECGECEGCCKNCGSGKCKHKAWLGLNGKLHNTMSTYVSSQIENKGESNGRCDYYKYKNLSFTSGFVRKQIINDQIEIISAGFDIGGSSEDFSEVPPRHFFSMFSQFAICTNARCRGGTMLNRVNILSEGMSPHFYSYDFPTEQIPCNSYYKGQYIDCFYEDHDPISTDGFGGGPILCGNDYTFQTNGDNNCGSNSGKTKYKSDLIYGGELKLYNKFGQEVDPKTVFQNITSVCDNNYGMVVSPPQCHFFL